MQVPWFWPAHTPRVSAAYPPLSGAYWGVSAAHPRSFARLNVSSLGVGRGGTMRETPHAHTRAQPHTLTRARHPPIPFADITIGTMQSAPGSWMMSPPGMGSVRTHRRAGPRPRGRGEVACRQPQPRPGHQRPQRPSNPPGPNPNGNPNPPYDNSALTQPTHPTNHARGYPPAAPCNPTSGSYSAGDDRDFFSDPQDPDTDTCGLCGSDGHIPRNVVGLGVRLAPVLAWLGANRCRRPGCVVRVVRW